MAGTSVWVSYRLRRLRRLQLDGGVEPRVEDPLEDRHEALVHELVAVTPGWVHPGTDLIASFPPFNNQPTQYRVTIGGDQRWFAQCGF